MTPKTKTNKIVKDYPIDSFLIKFTLVMRLDFSFKYEHLILIQKLESGVKDKEIGRECKLDKFLPADWHIIYEFIKLG